MRKIKIEIPRSMIDYVERLSYELKSYETIIKTMIRDYESYGDIDKNPNFKKYQSRYEIKTAEYEIAKREMSDSVIPKKIKEHNHSWDLDFFSGILTVTVNCQCLDNLSNEEIKELINDDTSTTTV